MPCLDQIGCMGRDSILLVESLLPCSYLDHPQLHNSLHHIKVDLLHHVLALTEEVGRHDIPLIGDHLENMDSGRKLGCANHGNISWVLVNLPVILVVDFCINTEDLLIRKEASPAGNSVL